MLEMDDTIACPGCARRLRLPAAQRDQPVRCPGCGNTFRLARAPVIEGAIQIEPPQRRGQFQADEPVQRQPLLPLDEEDIPDHLRPFVLPVELPGEGLSKALVRLLRACIILDLLYIAAMAALYLDLGGAWLGRLHRTPFWSSPDLISLIEALWVLVVVPTGIVFCMWMYRSYRNLEDMGVAGLHNSPGWAAGAFFVPILGLFLPYMIVQEMWKASDPDRPIDTWEWQDGKSSALIGWWWVFWIIHTYFTIGTVVGKGLSVMAAMLAIDMVRRLRARQVRKLEVLRSPSL
jgi:hypothetical protein